jgi:uncharacterized membrane protein
MRDMKTKYDEHFLETMRKDPGNWRGPFYYNPKDPRLMVPKLYPMLGNTFNFASPYAYITLAAILVIVLLTALVL